MPRELKPTTKEERDEWKMRVSNGYRHTRDDFLLRLIDDVGKLTAAVAKHKSARWGTGPVDNDLDAELYREVLDADKD